MLLILGLKNEIENTNVSTNTTCQTQLQNLIKYKWNNNYQQACIERLNGTVGRRYMYDIQDAITKGKVGEMLNILCGMIRREGR